MAAASFTDAKALVEPHQIGRRIDVHAFAGRLKNRTRERDGRTLAIGAGHMDGRRQMALRITERGKQPLDAIQRKVDALRMQRQQSGRNGADRGRLGRPSAHAGAVEGTASAGGTDAAGRGRLMRACRAPAGAFMNRRHSRAMVARSW